MQQVELEPTWGRAGRAKLDLPNFCLLLLSSGALLGEPVAAWTLGREPGPGGLPRTEAAHAVLLGLASLG